MSEFPSMCQAGQHDIFAHNLNATLHLRVSKQQPRTNSISFPRDLRFGLVDWLLALVIALLTDDHWAVMSCAELQDENERPMLKAVVLRRKCFHHKVRERREEGVALVGGEINALNRVRNAKKC